MQTVISGSPRALLLLLASITPFAPLGCGEDFTAGPAGGDDASDEGAENVPMLEGGSHVDATADGHADAAGNGHDDAASDSHDDVTGDGGPVGPTAEASAPEGSAEASATCSPPNLECPAGCVPSDVHDCGSCGNDCTNLSHVNGAVSCTAAGACSFPASSCAPGWANCDGNPANGCETDLSQTATCGTCTTACGASGPVCAGSGGTYGCVTGCSGATSLLCSGTCVDPTSNASHCDTCTNACSGVANGQPACMSSACGFTCNTGYSACPMGTPTACVDEQDDPSNCGACGKTCPQSSNAGGVPSCAAGACGLACTSGLTACPTLAPTECANTTDDLSNCGTCGKACSTSIANAHSTCTTSQCGIACNSGFLLCNGTSCVGPDPAGLFVSPGATGTTCTSSAPCGTIGAALGVAASGSKTTIYLDAGTYTEVVTLGATSVTIHGGWSYSASADTWTNCTTTTSTISAPTGQGAAVVGSANVAWTLDTLSIQNGLENSQTTASAGQTLYGVKAVAGTLTLSNVNINVGGGGVGIPGVASGPGAPAPTSCSAGGAAATVGPVGISGAQGTYTATGFVPVTGGQGTAGGAGQNGAAGGTGATYETCQSDGDGCGGGQVTAGAGQPGCGGGGGPGGPGGSGGGSSIGVFAGQGTTVNLDAVLILTGAGGQGGMGGGGGAGGMFSSGTQGTGVNYNTSCKVTPTNCKPGGEPPCGCTVVGTVTGPGGSAGGAGSNGGNGGGGGGGAGGDSLCYAMGGGGQVTGTPACTPGVGGAGNLDGNGSPTGQGVTGRSGQHN